MLLLCFHSKLTPEPDTGWEPLARTIAALGETRVRISKRGRCAISTEENKTVVRRGLTAWVTFDEGTFVECTDPNWRDYDGAGNAVDNLEKALADLRRHRVAFPDQRIEIHQILGEGDLVSSFVTVMATHTGRYFDVEPTGREVRLHFLAIHRVVDGQVLESRTMSDSPGFYHQVAGRPPPG
jgi:predicted ester cyclase